jgi:carbon-monoxide dehydrogenase large subunit
MTGTVSGALTGTRMRRKEDPRILTGRGRYVDDVQATGMLHACFVRSPVAHARLTNVDASMANQADGVVAVLTGADLADEIAFLDFGVPMAGLVTPLYAALAMDTVRYVGEPVAIVVAESRYAAEDGVALVQLDFDPLPVVMSASDATRDGAPRLHHAVADNLIYHRESSSPEVDHVFANADEVVTFTFDQHRWAPVPIETRGGVASYDPSMQMLTYETSCQSPHLVRFVLANTLQHPQHLIRVLAHDVGGGFGLKWAPLREDVVLCAAARRLGATVKWIEDRNENLIAGGHARDDTIAVEVAVRSDGTILALKADITLNLGAYPVIPSAAVTTGIMRCMLPGPYRIPKYASTERVVCTNKTPQVALRGPWALETLVRERALDHVARVIGISPVEIRQRNLLSLDEQPFDSSAGFPIDGVTAENTFRRALELVDYERTVKVIEEARTAGRIVGFGIATFMEPAPGTPEMWNEIGNPLPGEQMRAKLEPDGHLTLYTQQMPHGQSHETTIAQVAADEFGLRFEDVRLVFGDTQVTPFGMIGTGGSRAATMATGSAILATRAVKNKVLDVAAEMLEADVNDLSIHEGVVQVSGVPDARVSVAEIAMGCYMAPQLMPSGKDLDLQASAQYDGERGGFAQATHCCWVEIDRETGLVDIIRYLAVDDCGKMINPAVVEGQIRGAITMGIGGMLFEKIEYDENGNCQSGTFLDYLLPTAAETPDFELHHLEFESDRLVNSRGVGEGGTILAPAAILNAIEDAVIAAGGSAVTTSPVTPTRILELLGVIEPDIPGEH